MTAWEKSKLLFSSVLATLALAFGGASVTPPVEPAPQPIGTTEIDAKIKSLGQKTNFDMETTSAIEDAAATVIDIALPVSQEITSPPFVKKTSSSMSDLWTEIAWDLFFSLISGLLAATLYDNLNQRFGRSCGQPYCR